jgi:hypothetical protein
MQRNDACIALLDTAGAVDGLIDLQSFNADGFTLVVDDQVAANYRVMYLALGGADLTNVATGVLTEPGATGNQVITGLGFRPDLVLFGSAGATSNTPVAGSTLAIGAAVSSAKQGIIMGLSEDAQATKDTACYSRNDECIALPLVTGTLAIDARATLVSLDSDGFTINWLERAASRNVFFIAIKGPKVTMGDYTMPGNIGDGNPITLGFTPKAVLQFTTGISIATVDTLFVDDNIAIGAATGPAERMSMATSDQNGVATSDVQTHVEHDQSLIRVSGGGALASVQDVASIEQDGFTLVADTPTSGTGFVWYVALGEPLPPAAFGLKSHFGTDLDRRGWF